jgi:hypothetical protein
MRARVAYISSLGTTAILVAAALLMLVVVGALVAFRGWPGSANGEPVHPVALDPGSRTVRAVIARTAASTKHVVRVRKSASVATTRRHVSTAGLVKTPGSGVVAGVVMVPTPPATMTPVSPQPHGGSTPPAVTPAVAPPATPNPADPGPVTAPGGPLPDVQLPGTPLLDPSSSPSPQVPSSDQVVAMVGELIGTAPPPPGVVGSVVDSARR